MSGVRLQDRGNMLIVQNRAERRGALSPELYQALQDALHQARNPRIRAVILTGGAFFCAGGDLTQLKDRAVLPPDQRRARIEALHDLIRAMHAAPVPLIAAVEGGAAGAGLSLALACDMIVAASDAVFSAAYVKAGLTPDGGLTHALSRLLPRQLAMESCLLGRPFPATRLAALGVVNQLARPGQALGDALGLAQLLAQGPRQAQARIHALIHAAYDSDLAAQLDREADSMAEALAGPEAAEGMAAFLAKRRPDFNAT